MVGIEFALQTKSPSEMLDSFHDDKLASFKPQTSGGQNNSIVGRALAKHEINAVQS